MEPVEENANTDQAEQKITCAVVTGSSRGIGKQIAIELARRGCDLCLNCSSQSSLRALDELADDLRADYGIKVLTVCADISDLSEAAKMIEAAKETFGSVDILVNNAGITRDGLLARMKEEDFDRVIEVNLKGAFNCCKASISPMIKQRFGRIINMGSIAGVEGNAGQINYSASKAGLIGLSKSLAKEVASRNITVNVVAPGFIETDMTEKLSDQQKEKALEKIASRRLGQPQDVAALVGFLSSNEAGYITGQVIGIDGGLTL